MGDEADSHVRILAEEPEVATTMADNNLPMAEDLRQKVGRENFEEGCDRREIAGNKYSPG